MYTGLTGKLTIKSKEENAQEKKICYISNWSVEDKVEVIEVAELGKRAKDKMAGLRGWSASADGAIDFGDQSSQKDLFQAMHDGEPIECAFYLNNTIKFTGLGLIESLSVDLSSEDKGSVSISITGTDELVFPGFVKPTDNA